MSNAWTFVRCRIAGKHRWEPFSDDGESGWRCRDCGEVILERELVERDHEPDLSSPYWGTETRRRLDDSAQPATRYRHETDGDEK